MTRNNQKDAENIEKATELILDTIKQMDLAPIVGALNHDQDGPSDALTDMLENLAVSFELDEGSTMEDLASQLFDIYRKQY